MTTVTDGARGIGSAGDERIDLNWAIATPSVGNPAASPRIRRFLMIGQRSSFSAARRRDEPAQRPLMTGCSMTPIGVPRMCTSARTAS
jgi:hypothetical protein